VTPLLTDQIVVNAPRQFLWDMLYQPEALARVLPGCERLQATAADTYEGVFSTRLQFLTLRTQGTARLCDPEPPARVRLELSGQPLGLAGSFVVSLPLELEAEDGHTLVRYAVEVQVTGRLAVFGAPLLLDTLRRQMAELVRNLEREAARQQEE